MAAALLAGAVARVLLGRRGVFYRVAGLQAALADDCDGTMPPFDRVRTHAAHPATHPPNVLTSAPPPLPVQIVCLGPARAEGAAAAIRERTGVDVAVVDVNDRSRQIGACLHRWGDDACNLLCHDGPFSWQQQGHVT